jgi:hypothetical protein
LWADPSRRVSSDQKLGRVSLLSAGRTGGGTSTTSGLSLHCRSLSTDDVVP